MRQEVLVQSSMLQTGPRTERNGQNLLQQRPEPRCSGARHSSVLRKLHATFTASPSSSMNHRRLHHPQHQHHRVSHHLILVAAVSLITQYRRQSVSVIIARTTSIPLRTIVVAVALVSRFLHSNGDHGFCWPYRFLPAGFLVLHIFRDVGDDVVAGYAGEANDADETACCCRMISKTMKTVTVVMASSDDKYANGPVR